MSPAYPRVIHQLALPQTQPRLTQPASVRQRETKRKAAGGGTGRRDQGTALSRSSSVLPRAGGLGGSHPGQSH